MDIDSIGERFATTYQNVGEMLARAVTPPRGGSRQHVSVAGAAAFGATGQNHNATRALRCTPRYRLASLPGALFLGAALSMAAPNEAAAQNGASGICSRTQQVQDRILERISGVSHCADVTNAKLRTIRSLRVNRVDTLKDGDFEGLSSLETLDLERNQLSALPAAVFTGLESLRLLLLQNNRLRTLPPDVFAGLSSLNSLQLYSNELTTLPAGLFAGLTSLHTLDLGTNALTSVPRGIFDGLTSLNTLRLDENELRRIPAKPFSGLRALRTLTLDHNRLRGLPDGAFVGVPSLNYLSLANNPKGAPATMLISVSLVPVGAGGFRAVAPIGVPFPVVVPVRVTNGRIDGGATTVTIAAGATQSNALSATRVPDTVGEMTATIGTLPNVPRDHHGYRLVKAGDSPTVLDVPPRLTRITITSAPGDDGSYAIDDVITIQADFNRPVTVEPTPVVTMNLSWRPPRPADAMRQSRNVSACYRAGSGTHSLTFSYAVREGQGGAPALKKILTNIGPWFGTGTIHAGPVDNVADVRFEPKARDAAHRLDGFRPTLSSATTSADGTAIVLAFSEPLAAVTAPGTAFAVTADGAAVAVRTATVSGRELTLTLDSEVSDGQEVRVSYTEPTTIDKPPGADTPQYHYRVCGLDFADDDARAVQDRAGNDVRSFADVEVVHRTVARTPTVTNTPPALPALSVADARVREAADAKVAFKVSLSAASTATVTVGYATLDGIATAGADYVAASGTLTFAPGETVRTVEVAILDDAHDECMESFWLVLDNASGARIADGSGVGIIVNSDPIPKAWLARFGRTVAQQVLEGVESRFAASRGARFEGEVAGRRFGAAPGSGRWHASPGDTPFGRRGLEAQVLSGRDLFDRTAFSMSGGTEESGYVSLWGRGAVSRFDGREDELSLDGEVVTAMLGTDYMGKRWHGGVLLKHSRGDGGYRGPDGDGEMATSLTGVYPYGRYAPTDRLSVWAVAGYGEGELALTPDGGDATHTGIELAMAGAGARRTLLPAAKAGGFEVALTTDALFTHTKSGEVRGLAASAAGTSRLRLGVEASRMLRAAEGASLTPRFEGALRHDGGDAETGYGADMGAGLAFSVPAYGVSGEFAVRALVAHDAGGLRDRGLSGSLSWDPRPSSELGPSLSLRHGAGAPSSGGARALLGRETLAELDAHDDSGRARLEATLGYGSLVGGDRFVATPELSFGWTPDSRRYGLGWQLALARRNDVEFSVRLRAELDYGTDGARPEERLTLHTTLRW